MTERRRSRPSRTGRSSPPALPPCRSAVALLPWSASTSTACVTRRSAANGIVATRFGDGSAAARAIAIEDDGDIVVAGASSQPETGWDFALARYEPDGSLDPSFGQNGRVTTDLGASEGANALVLQPDGKLVVAGESGGDFALARYNPDGSLDTSFSGDGIVTTDFAGWGDVAYAVALQDDGRIVAAGSAYRRA